MFTLFDGLIELPFYTCDENNCVTLARTVCVPAYHEAYVQVETAQRFNNQEVLLEQPPHVLSVSVARALVFCKNNKAVCRVLNTNPYVVTLKKSLKLAKIAGLIDSVASMHKIGQLPLSSSSGERKQMCNDVTAAGKAKAATRVIDKSGIQVTGRGRPGKVTDVCMASPVTDGGVATAVNHHYLDRFHAEYGFKLSPQLDDAQRYQILEMLHRYKDVFARDVTEIKL